MPARTSLGSASIVVLLAAVAPIGFASAGNSMRTPTPLPQSVVCGLVAPADAGARWTPAPGAFLRVVPTGFAAASLNAPAGKGSRACSVESYIRKGPSCTRSTCLVQKYVQFGVLLPMDYPPQVMERLVNGGQAGRFPWFDGFAHARRYFDKLPRSKLTRPSMLGSQAFATRWCRSANGGGAGCAVAGATVVSWVKGRFLVFSRDYHELNGDAGYGRAAIELPDLIALARIAFARLVPLG